MIDEEVYYKEEILKETSEKELNEWLDHNPIPPEWMKRNYNCEKYAYAFTVMRTGVFYTWWRKHILKWDI
jgi:hypothetical protein